MRAQPVLAVFVATALGCGQDTRSPSSAADPRSADTTFVLATDSSVWGVPFDAARVLEVAPSGKETTFGSIRALAATPDGGVIIFDTKGAEGRVVRMFDDRGKFVRNIGRAGSGPGEYATDILYIAVHPDGSIIIRDAMRRVNRYARDGTFRISFALEGWGGFFRLDAGDAGSTFIPRQGPVGDKRPLGDRHAIVRYDSMGVAGDTIHPRPWLAGADTTSFHRRYSPREEWYALPDGRVVITRTDKVGFLLDNPRGGARPLVAERTVPPIRYVDEERKQMQANMELAQRPVNVGGEELTPGWRHETVPEFKPATSRVTGDFNGRVWLEKTQPSVKGERHCSFTVSSDIGASRCVAWATFATPGTHIYDVFQLDGAYLGEVRFPAKTRFMSFVGDYAWAVMKDDDDVDVLTKFRIRK